MFDCLNCGKDVGNQHSRFMVNPTPFIVPGEYFLCDEHKNIFYEFDDIYNRDGTRKKNVDHAAIREKFEGR